MCADTATRILIAIEGRERAYAARGPVIFWSDEEIDFEFLTPDVIRVGRRMTMKDVAALLAKLSPS